MNILTRDEIIRTALFNIETAFDAHWRVYKWMDMVEKGLVRTKDTIRVEVNEDGTVNLLDFRMPSESGVQRKNVPQEDVEPWIMETISVLRITDSSDLVPELGFKVSDLVYYIVDKRGESDE
jgi:hypothetical protein